MTRCPTVFVIFWCLALKSEPNLQDMAGTVLKRLFGKNHFLLVLRMHLSHSADPTVWSVCLMTVCQCSSSMTRLCHHCPFRCRCRNEVACRQARREARSGFPPLRTLFCLLACTTILLDTWGPLMYQHLLFPHRIAAWEEECVAFFRSSLGRMFGSLKLIKLYCKILECFVLCVFTIFHWPQRFCLMDF